MKTKPLKNQALIYDKDCPMCCLYTSAFIKAGVLEETGRHPYSEQVCDSTEWDAERAKNEIALVNYENGTVAYGIDSMFTVIGHRFSFLKPLFTWKPFHWSMKKLYSFISYNRKVIAPPANNPAEITCVPDVNLKYRWMYVLFAIFTATIINAFALDSLFGNVFWPALGFILGISVCRIIIQMAFVSLVEEKDKLLDYLGNLATVNLQLGFLVAFMFYLAGIGLELEWFLYVYFIAALFYINRIHFKRLKSLGMDPRLFMYWALQWVIVYLIAGVL